VITAVACEVLVDIPLERCDLAVVAREQLPQRRHSARERRAELERIELARAGGPEPVRHRRQHTLFRHHRVHLRLQAGA
jgi:hypothetical protein